MGNAHPAANDLWQGIGGHFDSISQVLCEFIDNSLSNIEKSGVPNKSIAVYLNEVSKLGGNRVRIRIEDSGTGIKNFDPVLRLGDKSERQTPMKLPAASCGVSN